MHTPVLLHTLAVREAFLTAKMIKDHPPRRGILLACRPAAPALTRCLALAALLLAALLAHVTLLTGWRPALLQQHFYLAKYATLASLGLMPRGQRPVTMAGAMASLGAAARAPVSLRSAALLALHRSHLEALRAGAGNGSLAAGAIRLAVRERLGFPIPRLQDGNEPWAVGLQQGCAVPCRLLPYGAGAAAGGGSGADVLADIEPCCGEPAHPGPLPCPLLTVIQENFYLTQDVPAPASGGAALAYGGARAPLAPATAATLQETQWLASYELDSHLPLPYLKEVRALLRWRAPLPAPALAPALRLPQRLPAIAAFISNCDLFSTQPPRALYVRELSRFYPVHHYGRCNSSALVGGVLGRVGGEDAAAAAAGALGALAEPFQGALDPLALDDLSANVAKLRILSAYRYAIAIENSLAQDYVSEKVYEALAAGAVPVYLGAPNVRDLLPDGAAIVHVRDHASPEALGAYLHALDAGGEGAWLAAHQQWRTRAVPRTFADLQALADYRSVTLPCRACACAAGLMGCAPAHRLEA